MIRHALWLAVFDFAAGFLVPIIVRAGVFRAVLIVVVAVGTAVFRQLWPAIQSSQSTATFHGSAADFLPSDILIALVATTLGVCVAAWIQHRGRAGEI